MSAENHTPLNAKQAALELNKLLTKGEVAAYFRVEVRTIDRWMSTGRIRYVRLPGGRVRFRQVDVMYAGDVSQTKNDPSMG